jgi:hypothetical protein
MAEGGTKNRLKPGLQAFRVPALAGGAVARASVLKFFEVILFASTPPPEGGTPNLHPDCEPLPEGETTPLKALKNTLSCRP